MSVVKLALMEKIESCWESRDFNSFDTALSNLPLNEASDLRYYSHWSAKKDLIQGNLELSLGKLNEALFKYGPHIGLLSDLASLHYLMKNSILFKSSIKRIISEYEICESRLSPKSKVKTLIFLGKLMEFEGELHKAYKFYMKAFDLTEDHSENKIKLLAQILRLDSFSSPTKTCANQYNILINQRSHGKDIDIEVVHALLLAECRLFGPALAEARLERLSKKGLSSADFKQLACHFLEECLIQDYQPSLALIQKIGSAENLDFDSYEATVLRHFGLEVPTSDDNAVSLFDDLRRLVLLYKKADLPERRRALKAQILFMLRPLTLETQKMYHRKWNFLHLSDETTILQVETLKNKISAHGKSLGLEKNLIIKVLTAFAESKQISTERLVQLVYGSDNYNESYYHRIRMLIGRFNKECQLHLGVDKVINVGFETCTLSTTILVKVV